MLLPHGAGSRVRYAFDAVIRHPDAAVYHSHPGGQHGDVGGAGMTLTLSIGDREGIDGGVPPFVLDRRGGVIGRSPTCDWSLPDPRNFISSRHAEVSFADGNYVFTDISMNGTLLNGSPGRMTAPRRIEHGDVFVIGHYEVRAALTDERAGGPGWSAGEGRWVTEPPAPDMPPAGAGWPLAEPEMTVHAASLPPAAAEPAGAADDIWTRLAGDHVIDWRRGGFGEGAPAAGEASSAALPRVPEGGWGAPASEPPPAPPPSPPRPVAAGADPAALAQAFVGGLGTPPGAVKDLSSSTMKRAGQLFRRLVAGLVVMVEARARAKSQMGAEATAFEFDGNNPLKFARSPEEAIATLLNPQQRGFMPAERAIEDAFVDLQSHQMATLKAMQGALRATLDRFSPGAIRERAEGAGVMARILPGARDAALWQAYEKEFGGVAQGSDEAFMDVFAREFRHAYEEQAAQQRARRR